VPRRSLKKPTSTRRGRPRIIGPRAQEPASPLSLPPAGDNTKAESSSTTSATPVPAKPPVPLVACPHCGSRSRATRFKCTMCQTKLPLAPEQMPDWMHGIASAEERKKLGYFPPDSSVRSKVYQILAMRVEGVSEEEIATAMGLKPATISQYMWIAGRSGWLGDMANPKDKLQYEMMHKVVRNLDTALDDDSRLRTGMPVKTDVALKVAEGTLFKQFSEEKGSAVQTNLLSIRVVVEGGEKPQVREDAIGGMPAYVEGETVGES
jgi:predicted transcriptional regulator